MKNDKEEKSSQSGSKTGTKTTGSQTGKTTTGKSAGQTTKTSKATSKDEDTGTKGGGTSGKSGR